jgi:hypothetical protein
MWQTSNFVLHKNDYFRNIQGVPEGMW